jgi:hypothetical protein
MQRTCCSFAAPPGKARKPQSRGLRTGGREGREAHRFPQRQRALFPGLVGTACNSGVVLSRHLNLQSLRWLASPPVMAVMTPHAPLAGRLSPHPLHTLCKGILSPLSTS